jgi:hypothetical protein
MGGLHGRHERAHAHAIEGNPHTIRPHHVMGRQFAIVDVPEIHPIDDLSHAGGECTCGEQTTHIHSSVHKNTKYILTVSRTKLAQISQQRSITSRNKLKRVV